jgi:hypothetical protein
MDSSFDRRTAAGRWWQEHRGDVGFATAEVLAFIGVLGLMAGSTEFANRVFPQPSSRWPASATKVDFSCVGPGETGEWDLVEMQNGSRAAATHVSLGTDHKGDSLAILGGEIWRKGPKDSSFGEVLGSGGKPITRTVEFGIKDRCRANMIKQVIPPASQRGRR